MDYLNFLEFFKEYMQVFMELLKYIFVIWHIEIFVMVVFYTILITSLFKLTNAFWNYILNLEIVDLTRFMVTGFFITIVWILFFKWLYILLKFYWI